MANSRGFLLFAIAVQIIISHSELAAITPPQKGKFPPGFWETIRKNEDKFRYGDSSWVKRMKSRKSLRDKMARGEISLASFPQDIFYLPVLLGKYSDKDTTYNASDFQWTLFSDGNPTGSLTKYYQEVSYGQFQLTGSVYGWFKVDNDQSYYAANNNGMNPNFPNNGAGFVRDVVVKADPSVDFRQFDNDGPDGIPNSGDDDGYADAVCVVCTGLGPDQTDYGNSNNIWPHESSLGSNEFVTNDLSINGDFIKVKTFFVVPELYSRNGSSTEIRPIGVFAHEFGHVLGLPDLYDRTGSDDPPDYEESNGLGHWCLMAAGNWGGDGNHSETPAHPSAWCKLQMGWITPNILEQDGGISISQVETSGKVYKLWEDEYQLSRYFLVENRQKVGFDKYLNGSGLLIYHVDENRWFSLRYLNGPQNNDETHKLVDLEEADGRDDLDHNENGGDAGDPFPGSSYNKYFTDYIYPNTKDYNGRATGVEITNISDPGISMTANIKARESSGYSLIYDTNGISGRGLGYKNPSDCWAGVLFTTKEAGYLTALVIGFREDSTSYELKIFNSFDGSFPSVLLETISGFSETAGWHTMLMNSYIALNKDQDFFVSLKIANKSYAISYDPYSEDLDRSFFSSDGISFTSLSSYNEARNANLRACINVVVNKPGIIVEEFINNDNNWPLEDKEYNLIGSISNGIYIVEYSKSGIMYSFWKFFLESNNFSTEADIKQLSGDGSYGIVFGYDSNKFFLLSIWKGTRLGFGLYKRDRINEEWLILIENQFSNYLIDNSYNNIKTVCSRDSIKVFLNNYEVAAIENKEPKAGWVGLSLSNSIGIECERIKIIEKETQTLNNPCIIKIVSVPDSLVPDTSNAVTIKADVIDSDGLKKLRLRTYESVLSLGSNKKFTESVAVLSWTDSTSGPFSPSDSFRWSITIPKKALGTKIQYQVQSIGNTNDTTTTAVQRGYTVAPKRGKRELSTAPVNVADVMRTVYIVADKVPAASITTVDWFGLDLDLSGDFDTPDIDRVLGIWRGTSTLLAGATETEKDRSAKSSLSYAVIDKANAVLSLNLENNGSLNMAVFRVKYDTEKFVLGEAVAIGRLADLTIVSNNNETDGVYSVVVINVNGRAIASGNGAIVTIPVSAVGEKFDGVGEISLLNAGFEEGVKAELNRNVLSPKAMLPKAFALSQNYPNPFNPSTTVAYDIPEGKEAFVRMNVYNMRGQLIQVLVNKVQKSGSYLVLWDGKDQNEQKVSSGVYFYRMISRDFEKTRKMVLLK